MAWLRMTDELTIKSKSVIEGKSSDSRSLLVRVAASHSAIINGNMRFYRPDRMQDGVKTWIPKYGFKKPVLVGHDEEGTVLGRVVEARYVDESFKYAADFPIIKDSLFYRTDSKKLPLRETVDWIVDHLMEQEDYTGLGYVELGLNITNPEAIEKVLRDEYLTVSVGFKTDSAICSACNTDWAVDDKCDHKLGSQVDGKSVFLISGNFDYEEVSFVTFPADPFAGTISKSVLTDAASQMFYRGLNRKQQSSIAMADSVFEADIHRVEETNRMPLDITKPESHIEILAEIKGDSLTSERAAELKALIQGWTPEADELKTKKRSLQSTLNAVIKKRGFDKKVADATATEVDKELIAAAVTNEDTCKCAEGSACECEPVTLDEIEEADRSYFEDEEGLYAELEIEIDAAIAANEIGTDAKDSKLSSEARKKLKSSTFCGPNRSFPVSDCAHVTASRRLISRAKISDATKSKILACVNRKAKFLTNKDASVPVVPTTVEITTISDRVKKVLDKLKLTDGYAKDALELINKLDNAYDKAEPATQSMIRGTTSALLSEWDGDQWLEYMKSQLKEERDMVVIPSSELADKEEAVNQLTEDKTTLEAKVTASFNTANATLKAYKFGLAQQIVMYKTMSGADGYKDLSSADRKIKVDELSKRHVEYLKDTVADIMSELKWVDATIAPRKEEVIEPGLPVNDNAQVNEPGTESNKDDKAAKAEEAKRLQDLRDQFNFMSPKEQRLFKATLEYEAVKLKK